MNNYDKTRIMIDKEKQKDIFRIFIKSFDYDYFQASQYLGITASSLSKYKRAIVRYLPKQIFDKIINYLHIEQPNIIFLGNLHEIRCNYMKESYNVLQKKYGDNWAKELANRRDFKGIFLSDFPDYLFVYLDDNYRKQLFGALYALFGSIDKAAAFLDVSISRLSFWCHGKQKDYVRNVEGPQFIPLGKLKLISRALIEDSREEFSMENIEKYVLMYRMRAGNPIKNPKFPIKESPEFIRLTFHLIGDGYAGKKGENANYRNICKELLEEFKKDLQIFGEVPIYEQEYSVKFPRVLAEIISSFYGLKFETFDSHISNKLLGLPKEYLYHGIRAYSDDEGSVYSNSIRLSSANYNLLIGIKKLLDFVKIRSNNVKSQVNNKATLGKVYYLDIRDIELYNKYIGFTHPKKKRLLEEYVRKIRIRRRKRLLKT